MDINERGRNLIVASILFLIFGASLIIVSNFTIQKINKEYIKQNIALIGALSKEQGFDENKVISIITKGDYRDYEKGKAILDKYSYKEDLDINLNPIMKSSKLLLYKNVGGTWTIIACVLLGLICLKDRKNLKISKEIVKRANKIVEGDFSEKEEYSLRDGAFETLYESFALMEDRIKRDITELNNEKINLKNIINDISHQLKTPLTALMTYNHILKDYKNMSNEDIDNFIELSNGQLERMDWLTITLLKYARLESNVVKYNKEEISMIQTINEAIAPLRVKAESKKQRIIFNYEEGEYLLKHDRKWLNEALSNIIKNGIEHTEDDGEINIRLRESPIYLEIEIEDNGEGIEETKINKIFNRFYKNSSSKKPKSIGIGLALTKSIIESHNGDIKVQSEVHKGTKFTVTFLK